MTRPDLPKLLEGHAGSHLAQPHLDRNGFEALGYRFHDHIIAICPLSNHPGQGGKANVERV